ncbi:MAG: PAS domain-containing protein [Rhodanobacter sp.]
MIARSPSPESDPTDELAALIRTLHETGRRLEELTGGEVDAVTDVDGRTFLLRNAQTQLRQSEAAKQAAVLNALPAHIAMLDVNGLIVSVNERWRRFGDSPVAQGPGYQVGLNYLKICANAKGDSAFDAHRVADGIRSVLEGGQTSFSIEYSCPASSVQRWYRMTVTPLADDHSNGAVVMHLNITAQRQAIDALHESERRFNDMLANVDLVSVMLDCDGRVIYCNECLLRLTDWPRDEVIGRDWFECFMPLKMGDMRPVFAAPLANPPAAWRVESDLLTRSGEHRLIRWNNSVLRSGSGEVIGTAGIGEDITDRKAAETVLAQRANQLERFHRLSVGRELRMVELKQQVNELRRQAGQEPAYDLTFLDSGPLQPDTSHEYPS